MSDEAFTDCEVCGSEKVLVCAECAPAWHDAPTVPGLWLMHHRSLARMRIIIYRGGDGPPIPGWKFYGPIPDPEDKS